MSKGKNLITGIRRSGKLFCWTTISSTTDWRKARVLKRELEIEDSDAEDPAKLGEQIRRQCPELTGAVSVVIPPDKMLMRVMELPECDAMEMDCMIRLQMDKCSPFPDDHMAVAYEIMPIDGSGRLALMAGVHKEAIDFTAAMCKHAGLELLRMDAEPAVWWWIIRATAAPEFDGRRLYCIAEPSRALLITTHNSRPAAFNYLNIPDNLTPEEYAGELTAEIPSLNLALDIELGVAPVAEMRFWTAAELPSAWSDGLRKNFNCVMSFNPLDELPVPAAGAARRMFEPPFKPQTVPRGDQAVMDFTPSAWHADVAARRMWRKLALAGAIIFIIWAVAIGGFFTVSHLAQKQAAALEQHLQELKTPSDEARLLQRKVRSFEQSMARDRPALNTLREISRLLPEGANISSFQFKRGRNVIVRGEAETVNPIYDFKQALDDSPSFEKIEMGSVQPGRRRDVNVQTFQMTIQLPEQYQ